MRLFLLLSLFMTFVLSGCVGTVQDATQSFSKINEAPKSSLTFAGITSASAISDSRIEVFFYPATGGSGKYTYDVIIGNAPFPISYPSDVLKPDFRGLLKVTLKGLLRLTTYQIKVEVRDALSPILSNSGVIKTVTTFNHLVADFNGISSAYNTPGQDGKDSIKIRWTPAKTSGGLERQSWDPKSYEIVLIDSERLTPNDMDIDYTPSDGRWVYGINHNSDQNEYVVRGLPSKKRFYVRMRAIHEASVEDVYDPRRRSELNTNYVIISTLSGDLTDIDFPGDSFAVSLAPGEQGLNSVYATWGKATGVFDHFRIYYGIVGGGVAAGQLPDQCLTPLLAPSDTVHCKKANFDAENAPVTGLTPYTEYEMVLVLCATTGCGPSERIVSPVRNVITDPAFPAFNGLKDITSALNLADIGNLYLQIDPPDFRTGYFDGLIIKMRRTVDGSDPEVEITQSTTLLQPVFHSSYNFLTDFEIKISGVDYLATAPYCFTIYPFKWDDDGITRRESPNDIWKCASPQARAPTVVQYAGLTNAYTEADTVYLNWEEPTKGIYSHYEVFWNKAPWNSFNWGHVLATAGNFDYSFYERRTVPAGNTGVAINGLANGSYIFGVITYYTYVTDSGVVVLRSETNDAVLNCTIDGAISTSVDCY